MCLQVIAFASMVYLWIVIATLAFNAGYPILKRVARFWQPISGAIYCAIWVAIPLLITTLLRRWLPSSAIELPLYLRLLIFLVLWGGWWRANMDTIHSGSGHWTSARSKPRFSFILFRSRTHLRQPDV